MNNIKDLVEGIVSRNGKALRKKSGNTKRPIGWATIRGYDKIGFPKGAELYQVDNGRLPSNRKDSND